MKKIIQLIVGSAPFNQVDKENIAIHTYFDEEGLYNLQAKIEMGNQTIQPTLQIVVGEVASIDGKPEKSNEEGHSNRH